MLIALLAAGGSAFGGDVKVWNDPVGDAVIRRTDLGVDGPLHPQAVLPDVIQVRISGWSLSPPFTDPYSGSVPSGTPHLLRLDVIFRGVVNPPGTLDLANFNPFQYGPSPLHGYLEFDVDRDGDTGGELASISQHQHLANAARFGGMPADSLGASRGVRWGTQIDTDYNTPPQFERSGTDWALVFCGCWETAIIHEGGGIVNGIFESGETWIVRGRFWQRAAGYRQASFMSGGFLFGLYDKEVNLRWSHNASNNRTTVTLVYPLTMQGAAQLAGPGTAQQPMNYSASDHTSIQEGLQDIIDYVNTIPLPPGPTRDFAIGWLGGNSADHLDPTNWKARALFGTSYATPQTPALYVWTDTGFDDVQGDQNSDEIITLADRLAVRQAFATGPVQIPDFGPNFSSFDVNGDGVINALDSIWYCRADVNDDLSLNILDFSAFLSYFASGSPRADINRDGVLNIADFSHFLAAYATGCP